MLRGWSPADITALVVALTGLVSAITALIVQTVRVLPSLRAHKREIVQLSEKLNGHEVPPPP